MAMVGMDVEAVKKTGQSLQTEAEKIRQIVKDLTTLVNSTTWEGPDAKRFKGDEWNKIKGALQTVADTLNGAGQSALNNAKEQDEVSNR